MTTYLVHLPIDMRAFHRWAGERELIRRGTFDAGFALHVLLSGLFCKAALQPFRLFASERRRTGSIYAYADVDGDALRQTAQAVGTPDCLAALDPGRLRSKALTAVFEPGQRLGFDLRVRPVRRLRRRLRDPQSGQVLPPGKEVDAFRVAALNRFPDGWTIGPGEETQGAATMRGRRGNVYTEWLVERFGDAATIEIGNCRLAAFQRSRTVRGDGAGPEGPDATLHGVLTVKDADAFVRLLRKGVGRHKAYGYGMLLLRPPGAAPMER